MSQFPVNVNSEADTERLGAVIAACLRSGDVIALNGPLGAGKTRLVRAVVAALHGTDDGVNSPTFVIVQRYEGPVAVDHIDAYRLADSDEFLSLGGEEILIGGSVCLIEWAERISDALPPDHVQIDIIVTNPTSRTFEVTGHGDRGREFVAQVEQAFAQQDAGRASGGGQ